MTRIRRWLTPGGPKARRFLLVAASTHFLVGAFIAGRWNYEWSWSSSSTTSYSFAIWLPDGEEPREVRRGAADLYPSDEILIIEISERHSDHFSRFKTGDIVRSDRLAWSLTAIQPQADPLGPMPETLVFHDIREECGEIVSEILRTQFGAHIEAFDLETTSVEIGSKDIAGSRSFLRLAIAVVFPIAVGFAVCMPVWLYLAFLVRARARTRPSATCLRCGYEIGVDWRDPCPECGEVPVYLSRWEYQQE